MNTDETGRKWENWSVLEEMEKTHRRQEMRKRLVADRNPGPTITSGFNREVLRLTAADVEFLTACGIKVE